MEEAIHRSQKCLKDNGKYRKWKKEELEYLREICYGRGYKEIAEMITERFGMECSEIRVRNRMNKEHLKTGIETKFQKGHTPYNKGVPRPGWRNNGTFKKGHISPLRRKIGDERMNRDGYWEVKVDNPSVWKLKHKLIYEQHYGPLPEGGIILFADGNKSNFDIDNLILTTQREMMAMNKHQFCSKDPELTKTGMAIVRLKLAIQDKERGKNGSNSMEDH